MMHFYSFLRSVLGASLLVLLPLHLHGQSVPQAIAFQGVAIDQNGQPVPGLDQTGTPIRSTPIRVRFSILENTSNGPLLYSEEHAVQTDQFGRFSTNIGQGTSLTGNFSTIDWLGGKRFLEVSVDLSGLGTNYTLTSVQEFLSVPYALVADRVRNNDDADANPLNEIQSLTVVNDTVLSISGGNSVHLPTSVGPQGPAGPAGPQGAAGAQGPQGIAGHQGPAGPQGATGAQGPQGIAGLQGPAGPQGLPGATGAPGLTGPQGSVGATGPQGSPGPAGPQGIPGATGPAGLDGKTILSGSTVPAAAAGSLGDFYLNTASNILYGPKTASGWGSGVSLVGPQGATGPQGIAGLQGPAGAQGLTGATGPQGPVGPAGPAGAQGLTGATGPQGVAGPQGPPGPSGAQGPAGAEGPAGPIGLAGPVGPAGIQGPQGLLVSGTSIGNTPYWDGSQWVVNSGNIYNNGARVGIGTTAPNTSAKLEVASISQGFLPPRLTTVQRDAINSPAVGLTIYNVTDNCLQWWNGMRWYDGCGNNTPTQQLYATGSVFCASGPTEVFDVTNPITGKVWMDRNLGASRVATSSSDNAAFGDLYQWGRRSDGHQCRNSAITNVLSSVNQPTNGSFILAPNNPYDWRNPQNTNLWQGVNGVNNPCPTGYRLPTEAEISAELASWSSNDYLGAFGSPLKLPVAGSRSYIDGSFINTNGDYWSSTINNNLARSWNFGIGFSGVLSGYRAYGASVRCIKN